jgi:ABC-type bacteriocin/lantibiotic exporter with double-glycine peptidase domain
LTRLLQFFGTLAVILYYDPTLALLALLSAPITLLMSRYVIKMMRHHNKEMRRLSSQMMIFNEESFQNIQLIKAFDRTDAYSEKHRKLQQRLKDTSMEYNRFSIHKNTIMSLVGTVVALVCFSWSAYRLWSGYITYGTMTLFLQLSGSLTAAFAALAGLIPGAINAATAAGRIMDIMDLPAEDHSDAPTVAAFIKKHEGSTLRIEAEALNYHYDDGRSILAGGNFTAEAGQIVTFIGPSGEGKTTLLRLLLGVLRPKKGTLRICAEDGDAIDVSPSTRTLFAYVPQENTMFSGTVAENLRLVCPEATDTQLFEALRLACAADFVRQLPLGLDTQVREQGGFSEGQLQRLSIARALLSDAPILLLDEATSALDMETEQMVLKNILGSQKGRTCIVATHRPSVLQISHRIYRIRDDQIEMVDCAGMAL